VRLFFLFKIENALQQIKCHSVASARRKRACISGKRDYWQRAHAPTKDVDVGHRMREGYMPLRHYVPLETTIRAPHGASSGHTAVDKRLAVTEWQFSYIFASCRPDLSPDRSTD
jgi:hypothetical protein